MPHAAEIQSEASEGIGAWFVYVLASERRNMTYVGIALDPGERLAQHNGEAKGGAKSTRAGRPWRLAQAHGPFPGRPLAQAVEYAIKQLPPSERLLPNPLG